MNRNRTGRRWLALVPVAVVGVLALTGCDPLQAGSAAVVGRTRVTESQVDADAKSVLAELHKTGGQVPSTDDLLKAQVDFRVDARLVEVAAQRQGIHITQGQIDDLIASSGGRAALEKQLAGTQGTWLPPGQLDALARVFLTQQALGPRLAPGKTSDEQTQAVNDYMTKLAQDVGVAVSPRYGAFDPKTLQIVAAPDDLSVPAGGTTPTASASSTPAG